MSDLVFVRDLGFRDPHALGTRANVVVECDGAVFTGAITPDRDGCRLNFTVIGLRMDISDGYVPYDGHVGIADERRRDIGTSRAGWYVGGNFHRERDGTVTLQYGTALESLANDTKAVIVEFAVNDTEWRVELPVEPVISNGVRAKRIDIVDSQRGIAFAARAIARAADFTAIEFEAFLDPPDVRPERRRRRIRGLGQSAGPGRLCGDQIVLRTETDELFVERGHPLLAEGAGRHREAVLFPPLPETLRTVTAELEHVWIDEPTDEIVRVPLPGEADIAIADCRAHVVTKRVPGADTAGSARVEVTPLDDVDAARRLAFISGVNVPDSSRYGMRIEHAVGKSPVVEVPEPSGTATEVTLQYPVIQIRGPWRLAISLPSVGAL